ncbi:hypothetical protein YPPY94_4104, partial [Yersinia pestis PY-94]
MRVANTPAAPKKVG